MDAANFFTSENSFPYHAQMHGFAGAPSHVTARRELDGWYIHSKEKITLPGSVLTVIGIVECVTAIFQEVSCRNVKPALLSAN